MKSALRLLSAALTAFLLSSDAAAQERRPPVAELAVGVLQFPDDGIVTEGFLGGAGRFYVSPRISIGPEIAAINGERHSHLMLTGNLTVDLLAPRGGDPRPATPFVVGGGGFFRTREQFPNNRDFTSSDGAFTAGGGLRARVGDALFVGAEARIGWELHIRLNALVGVRLGR